MVTADEDVRAVVQLVDPLELGTRSSLHVEEAVAAGIEALDDADAARIVILLGLPRKVPPHNSLQADCPGYAQAA